MPQATTKKPKEPDLLVLAMRKAHAEAHGKPTPKRQSKAASAEKDRP